MPSLYLKRQAYKLDQHSYQQPNPLKSSNILIYFTPKLLGNIGLREKLKPLQVRSQLQQASLAQELPSVQVNIDPSS